MGAVRSRPDDLAPAPAGRYSSRIRCCTEGNHARLVARASCRDTWRNHIQAYIDTHPQLSSDAIPVLEAAMRIDHAGPVPVRRQAARARRRSSPIRFRRILGRGEAEYLLYRLGPERRENRQHRAAWDAADELRPRHARRPRERGRLRLARASWGCDGYGSTCRTSAQCNRRQRLAHRAAGSGMKTATVSATRRLVDVTAGDGASSGA